MSFQDSLSEVLSKLLASVDEGNRETFKSVSDLPGLQGAVETVKARDPSKYSLLFSHQLNKAEEGLLSTIVPGMSFEAKFLFKEYAFVARYFRRLIERYEGMACCADKTRTVLKHLCTFLVDGTEISFDYEQEYTFHLPQKVFAEHAEIVAFFSALCQMHNGAPSGLIACMGQIEARLSDAASNEKLV